MGGEDTGVFRRFYVEVKWGTSTTRALKGPIVSWKCSPGTNYCWFIIIFVDALSAKNRCSILDSADQHFTSTLLNGYGRGKMYGVMFTAAGAEGSLYNNDVWSSQSPSRAQKTFQGLGV